MAVAIGGVLDLILAATLVGPYGALGATIANVGGWGLAAHSHRDHDSSAAPLSMTWGRYVGVLCNDRRCQRGGWLVQTQVPGSSAGLRPAGNGQFTGAVRRRVRLHVRARRGGCLNQS